MKNGARRLVAVGACLVLLAVVGADGRCTQRSSEGALLSDLGQTRSIQQHRSTGSSIAGDSERQRSGTQGNPQQQHAWSTSSSSGDNSVAGSRSLSEPISFAPAAALTAAGGDKSPLGRKGQPAGEQQQAPGSSANAGHGSSSSSKQSPDVIHPSRRRLQQSALCPEGCAPGMCVPGGVDPALGFKCQQCLNNLMVDKATGKCACPAGRYSKNPNSCTDCPKGSYCDGGVYSAGNPANEPAALPCGGNMTTLGLRSTSARSCVNLPGNFYTISPTGVPGASICPLDTYGPGLRKQRACVPCPPNYVTNGKVGAVSPMQCVIPPGYFLKSPGVIAPCPMGEWKDGTGPAGNCTKCAVGVTTPSEASGSAAACSVLLPGYYAAAMAGSEITISGWCPQKFYCPGGIPTTVFNASNPSSLNTAEPTIKACPSQSWTQERGSISPEQCLTPPGHFTAGGVTSICPEGSFRADWVPPIQATACEFCGDSVLGDKSDRITVLDPVTGASSLLPVQTTAGDCYIEAGQGLFYASLTQTYRARNCETNSYGARTRFYGLVPYPCRPCPTGLVTSNNTALYPNSSSWWRDDGAGRRGFISEAACVTPPGWGYSSRLANPCAVGFYNPRDTYAPCTACPIGRTTLEAGAGSTLADCGIAAGYGGYGGVVVQCPQGTYNNASYKAYTAGASVPCSSCPQRTTTAGVGATVDTQCNQCVAGYGDAGCLTACGGGTGTSATYGPAGRAKDTPCTACDASATGYSFLVNGGNELFAPNATAPAEASSPNQCFSEYAQLADAWWLPIAPGASYDSVGTGGTFADCVAACSIRPKCEYLTYDYAGPGTCYVREAKVNGQAGAPHVGFKAVPSSDVGRSWSLSVRNTTDAKSTSAGQYTWWRDDWFAEIGTQTAPSDVLSFTTIQDCLDACDNAGLNCAGVVLRPATDPLFTPRTCLLISGDTTLGLTTRSMTRTVVSQLTLPNIV